jgi:hypothetical protein
MSYKSAFATVILFFTFVVLVKAETDIPRKADISVSGIFLNDPESTRKVIGRSVKPKELGDDFPTIQICNSKKTEILTLVFHYGGIRDSSSEFRIRNISEPPADSISPSKQIEHFITGKGIHLGMSKKDISKILGDSFSEHKNGKMTTIHYRIDDFKKSRFLEKYNMPVYYGLYHFEKDTLIKFEFGFEYP